MEINIDVSALENLRSKFDDLRDRALDISPIGEDLADIMRVDIRKRFASSPSTTSGGVVYGGMQWDRLTDAAFARDKNRRSGKIGIVTGQLRAQSTLKGGGNVYAVDGTDFMFELVGDRAQNFSQYRQLVGWHPELLYLVSQKVSQYLSDAIDGQTT